MYVARLREEKRSVQVHPRGTTPSIGPMSASLTLFSIMFSAVFVSLPRSKAGRSPDDADPRSVHVAPNG